MTDKHLATRNFKFVAKPETISEPIKIQAPTV